MAFTTGQLVLWLALDAYFPRRPERALRGARLLACAGLLALLCVQLCYGAFMAGTHAGLYYASFPDMNGRYAPGAFFTGTSIVHDALNSPIAIHYLHRALAFALLFGAIGLFAYMLRVEPRTSLRRAAGLVAALVFVQFNLGALTVVTPRRGSVGGRTPGAWPTSRFRAPCCCCTARSDPTHERQAAPATTHHRKCSPSSHTP